MCIRDSRKTTVVGVLNLVAFAEGGAQNADRIGPMSLNLEMDGSDGLQDGYVILLFLHGVKLIINNVWLLLQKLRRSKLLIRWALTKITGLSGGVKCVKNLLGWVELRIQQRRDDGHFADAVALLIERPFDGPQGQCPRQPCPLGQAQPWGSFGPFFPFN